MIKISKRYCIGFRYFIFLPAFFFGLINFSSLPCFSTEKRAGESSVDLSMLKGTGITYRNIVRARSFNKSADLTYNPYYAMELDFAASFHPKKYTELFLDSAFSIELTDSDVTTKRGEIESQDIFFHVALKDFIRIPILKIDVIPSVRFFVPSSKISQARTLVIGVRPEITFVKKVNALSGLEVLYSFWIRKDFHEWTTVSTDFPQIAAHSGTTRSADSFFNMGQRNVSFAVSSYLGLSLFFTKYIGANIGFGFRHGFLYPIESIDPRVSYEAQEGDDIRYQMLYQGEIVARTKKVWTFALGFLTENSQLAQDATYESPFFNRHTAVYFDVRLDVADASGRHSPKGGKK